ncbi:hypothetical protein N7490_006568 [Penicillium lividum]|nr:hypothetical protein N7490_006568 [Penicillium lividum]
MFLQSIVYCAKHDLLRMMISIFHTACIDLSIRIIWLLTIVMALLTILYCTKVVQRNDLSVMLWRWQADAVDSIEAIFHMYAKSSLDWSRKRAHWMKSKWKQDYANAKYASDASFLKMVHD